MTKSTTTGRPSIGIIGAGGAGMAAAWALSKAHDITVFEASAHAGGHAYSHPVKSGNDEFHVDMGVEYFNERLSPNLCALLKELGVETYASPMSFRSTAGEGLYWSNASSQGVLRSRHNAEMDRFHLEMSGILSSADERFKSMTLREFLDEKNFSQSFTEEALLPLLTTFSGCHNHTLSYSLMYTVLSFNMNLLSFFSTGYWRKASGGIGKYISGISDILGDRLKLSSPISTVREVADGLEVVQNDGQIFNFDHVLFATHADVALSLIADPDPDQERLLGAFEYVNIESVMHQDTNVLEGNAATEEYLEFRAAPKTDPSEEHVFRGSLTRYANRLFPNKASERPLLVTFDPFMTIKEEAVLCRQTWKLPKLRPVDMLVKTQLKSIQGRRGIYFCGTDTSFTGHEGAIVSGLVAACHLGAEYPFPEDLPAQVQFNLIKQIMGLMSRKEMLVGWLGTKLFSMVKAMNLHKKHSHLLIKDLFV
jgi:predicted NAD/FAD-binding protein